MKFRLRCIDEVIWKKDQVVFPRKKLTQDSYDTIDPVSRYICTQEKSEMAFRVFWLKLGAFRDLMSLCALNAVLILDVLSQMNKNCCQNLMHKARCPSGHSVLQQRRSCLLARLRAVRLFSFFFFHYTAVL